MGKKNQFRYCITLLLVFTLFLSLSNIQRADAEFSPEVNRLLVFFKDVLMMDTSRCTVTVSHDSGDNSPELGTRGLKEGKITLIFDEGGSVDSLFKFKGNYLTWCLVYYDINNQNPIPYLQEPSDDPFELALSFLEKYEAFTQDPNIREMRNLLDSAVNTKPVSKTEGNLKLEITDYSASDFSWSYTLEGEDYYLLRIGFFDPPHIFTLGDNRWRYNMESSVFPSYVPMDEDSTLEIPSPSPNYPLNNQLAQTKETSLDRVGNHAFTFVILLATLSITVTTIVSFRKIKHRNSLHFERQITCLRSESLHRRDLCRDSGGRSD